MNFRLDPRFAVAFLRSGDVRDLVMRKAHSVAARARQLAPDDPLTGAPDIKSSIGVELEETPRGIVARVRASDWKAHFHEFGTVKMPAHPFLRPALEAEDGLTIAEVDLDA